MYEPNGCLDLLDPGNALTAGSVISFAAILHGVEVSSLQQQAAVK